METTVVEAPAPAAPATPAQPAAAPAAPVQADPYRAFIQDSTDVPPDTLANMVPMPPAKGSPRLADLARPAPTAPAPAAPAVPPAEPAPEAAVTPVPEVPAAPTPEPSKETPEDFTKNWRLTAKNAKQARVLELLKKGVDPQEAVKEVYGEAKAEAAPAQPISEPVQQPDPVAEADSHINALAQKIAELDAQIEKVSDEGDNKTAIKLLDRKAELRLAQERAKDNRELIRQDIEASKARSIAAKLDDQVRSSMDQMFEAYPKLTEKNSAERAQFNLKVRELETINGKDFRDKNPGWPMMVARIVDAEQGWSRSPQPPAAPAPVANPIMNQPAKVAPAPIPAPPVRATAAAVITPSTNPGGATPPVDKYSFIQDTKDVLPDALLWLADKVPVDPRLTAQSRTDYRTWQRK